jgi:hypothetical protein
MREMTPRIAILRVVFPDRCPLALRNIRTPFLPVCFAFPVVLEAFLLLAEVLVVINDHHVDNLY